MKPKEVIVKGLRSKLSQASAAAMPLKTIMKVILIKNAVRWTVDCNRGQMR